MAIPGEQLEVWSHQGSITQSSSTYGTIKRALEASDANYASMEFEVFLQGSYGNDTNIYAESDVDVVIRLDSIFYYDLKELTAGEAAAFQAAYSEDASYSYKSFRGDVVAALVKSFGAPDVKPEKKAVKIKANGGRRGSDVVVAVQFRKYRKFPNTSGARFEEGICFFTSEGDRLVNYPKQHSENLTTKHQATNEWLKPMVRILKNMRGKLVDDGVIGDRVAPSYFLEGLLYNVPKDKFGGSYADTFVAAWNWIVEADWKKFVCPSERHWLVRDSAATSWPVADCELFVNAVTELWNNWC
jgi:hypothetical protein